MTTENAEATLKRVRSQLATLDREIAVAENNYQQAMQELEQRHGIKSLEDAQEEYDRLVKQEIPKLERTLTVLLKQANNAMEGGGRGQ